MMKIRFIKDGNEGVVSRWRYKKNEEVLLPDYLAQQAIDEGLAIRIDRPTIQNALDPAATRGLHEAKNSDRSLK